MYSKNYISSFQQGIDKVTCKIAGNIVEIDDFFISINDNIVSNTRLFFYGNGASMAFASHMSLDWHKNGKIESHTLSDISLLTAFMNDYSKEEMFAEHLRSFRLRKSDIVCSISSSGNSPNVIGALKYARSIGAVTISFSGLNPENESIKNSDYSLFVPLKTYGQVECAHQLYLHSWLDMYMGVREWDRNEVQNMNSNHFRL